MPDPSTTLFVQHILVALPEVAFHLDSRSLLLLLLLQLQSPRNSCSLAPCLLCFPMNIPTHESPRKPSSSRVQIFLHLPLLCHSSSMSCFCYLRKYIANLLQMIVLNVFFAISALTRCGVGGVMSKLKNVIGILLVHPHNREPRSR